MKKHLQLPQQHPLQIQHHPNQKDMVADSNLSDVKTQIPINYDRDFVYRF